MAAKARKIHANNARFPKMRNFRVNSSFSSVKPDPFNAYKELVYSPNAVSKFS
jgi:hypothetical protein